MASDPGSRGPTTLAMLGAISLAVLGSAGMAGCDDSRGIELDDGFQDGISSLGDGNAASSFREAMNFYHVNRHDITCMMNEAFAGLPATEPSEGFSWSAEELNQFAVDCDVDFSDLWYSAD